MNPREEAKGGNNDEDDGGIELVVQEPYDLLSRGLAHPTLLRVSAGGEKCCIFRISHKPKNKNFKAVYEPRVVSFGPYHHGKENLHMVQQHKPRLMRHFMAKAKQKGVDSKDLIEAVSKLVEDIRESYSESLYEDGDLLGQKKLIDMMVIDGCFILMMFLVVAGKVSYHDIENDSIFIMPWILPAIRSDLLLLENQVPFFLLQTLFERSKIDTSKRLNEYAFNFFNSSIQKPIEFWIKHEKLEAKHLLDLIRKTFVPTIPKEEKQESDIMPERPHRFRFLIRSATKLRFMGLHFKRWENRETLLDIKFKKNLLKIPPMILDDFTTIVFFNCVAFEEVYWYCSKHIISYVVFMECLLENEDDARLLSSRGIIVNRTGSVDEVLQFFKVINKDIYFDINASYLADLMEGVNEYCVQGFHMRWAVFKNTQLTYNSPRTMLSFCTGLTVLLLTGLQAAYTVYTYHRPQK